jgi:hypothetical protein
VISQATLADVLIVASTMRESDRAEIYATRWGEDPFDVAHFAMLSPFKFTYRDHAGALVAAFGALEPWPGVWSIWMFANDLWDERVGGRIVRFVRRLLRVEMKARNAHRLECRSLATHTEAHRFIRALGPRGGVRQLELWKSW